MVADMTDDETLTIGELARRTGLPVKTIRFWSDEGLVPPVDRTPAGYRLYDRHAQVRLGLVRTLREFDLDLPTIRGVLERQLSLPEVADAHASALGLRIRALQLHRSVLRTVAGRGTATTEEIALMHKLAQLSAAERRRLVEDFIDDTFSGLDLGPDFLPMMRNAMPDLPEEPTQQQVDAWVELAELVQDTDFRASLRRAAVEQARAVAEVGQPSPEDATAMTDLLREKVQQATENGIEPNSERARPIVDELAAAYARHTGNTDGPEFRSWLVALFESSHDPRYERYWQLLAVINGQSVPEGVTSSAQWLMTALRSR